MVLPSWQSHCKSSPGSFDECRLSTGWPPIGRPSQPTWIVSLPVQAASSASTIDIYYYCSAQKLILILPPHRLSQSGHCSNGAQPVPKAIHRSGCHDKHTTAHGEISTWNLSHCSQADYNINQKDTLKIVDMYFEQSKEQICCKPLQPVGRETTHPQRFCFQEPSNLE